MITSVTKLNHLRMIFLSLSGLLAPSLASGSDDGSFFSTRKEKLESVVAHFEYHKKAITSLSGLHMKRQTLAVTSGDHQLTIWDFALEKDAEEEAEFRAKMKEQANALTIYPLNFCLFISNIDTTIPGAEPSNNDMTMSSAET
ncbi:hypothetical protein PR202_ga00134 [Eleusine coracana subsp. coracana]|uniref:Uncharacterized protein n=1 Tax=Eleusine coracana subsp. coracana TaxID=191504 RepID=A0AAV5BB59_ELECO|nr:hypothetical protein PR202_ga00134 [Eleusine coracana subsp. coracana]